MSPLFLGKGDHRTTVLLNDHCLSCCCGAEIGGCGDLVRRENRNRDSMGDRPSQSNRNTLIKTSQ
jgi:hypothetical protein